MSDSTQEQYDPPEVVNMMMDACKFTYDEAGKTLPTVCRTKAEKALARERADSLLRVIEYCAEQRVTPPEWASDAFSTALRKWRSCESQSLDEALGAEPLPEKTALNNYRNSKIESLIWCHVSWHKSHGRTIPWEEIGERYGCGKSKAQSLYYGRKQRWGL